MFNIQIKHECALMIGGVQFIVADKDVFSAYRLASAYIETNGMRDSIFTVECGKFSINLRKGDSESTMRNWFSTIRDIVESSQ